MGDLVDSAVGGFEIRTVGTLVGRVVGCIAEPEVVCIVGEVVGEYVGTLVGLRRRMRRYLRWRLSWQIGWCSGGGFGRWHRKFASGSWSGRRSW